MTAIMGHRTLGWDQLNTAARALGASDLFVNDMLPALWKAALRYGIDPLVMVAQAAHETGWGRFAGRVKASQCNPCGLKVHNLPEIMALLNTTDSDHTLCHANFPSWAVGAEAHAQHLRVYGGNPVDSGMLVVDPRYWVVAGINERTGRAPAVSVVDLGGKWAPSPDYGLRVQSMADRIAVAGVR
jgi:hypothetical protein